MEYAGQVLYKLLHHTYNTDGLTGHSAQPIISNATQASYSRYIKEKVKIFKYF